MSQSRIPTCFRLLHAAIQRPTFAGLALTLSLSLWGGLAPDATAAPVARVSREVRNNERVALPGTAHPRARAQDDRGPVDGAVKLDRMVLLLTPSAQQQQALDELLQAQNDPASPQYRQWLTPAEFGARFGVASADVNAITGWLGQQGFQVDEVTPGARHIVFSGNVRQLRESFGVALRRYERDGERHVAHTDEVQIPQALSGVVAGIASLSDFRSRPQNQARVATAQATYGPMTHYLAAGDFHTIYNLKPVLNQGIQGAGRTIVVVGRSNIALSDVNQFRSSMALPSNPPQIVLGGAAPGFVPGDELESDLDVQWAGAVAPAATVQFVTTASTATSDGVGLSSLYAVNNNLGDVISVSYGLCEGLMGTSGTNFYNSLWQQAAAQGQTVVVSSGDSGAAGCDPATATTATGGLGVNALCSSPYSTCVGGTQFNDTANPSAWWSNTNDAGGASALSYIPESAWNESGSKGGSGLLSSGGGRSIRFTKPSWQNTTGVPADGRRDVPDVSLNASTRVGYLITSSDNAGRTPTTYVAGGTSASAPALAGILALVGQTTGYRLGHINPTLYALANLQAAGGKAYYNLITTGDNSVPGQAGFSASSSSPRYNLATGLGTVNGAVFVRGYTDTLPATSTSLSVASSVLTEGQPVTLSATVVGSGATGAVQFTDNGSPLGAAVALSSGTATLVTSALAAGNHTLAAQYSGDRTHQASASNGVDVVVRMATAVAVSASPDSIAFGQGVALSATVSRGNGGGNGGGTTPPTGTVQFKDGATLLGTPVALSNGVATLNTNAWSSTGTRSITAVYAGDGAHAPSTSASVALTIAPGTTSTALSVSPTQPVAGQGVTLTATVTGFQPSGAVTFLDGSTPLGTAVLNGNQATLLASGLSAGPHSLSARYAGDANHLASTSQAVSTQVASPPNETTGGDGDVPTLPGWAALLLSGWLGRQAWRRHAQHQGGAAPR